MSTTTSSRPVSTPLDLLVTDLAARPDLWEPHVRPDPAGRTYARIVRTDAYEAWVLTWLPGQVTGWHDHGGSAGAFSPVRGTLHERTLGPAGRVVDKFVPTGGVRVFPAEHAHDVAPTGGPAVSLHVYAPALVSMTRYELRDGALVTTGTDRAGVQW